MDFEVELTVNKGRTEPCGNGDAYDHVAFAVDDLDSENALFEELGLASLPLSGGCQTGSAPLREPD